MNILKPYEFTFDHSISEKLWVLYNHKNIKTNLFIFMEGLHLPSDDAGKLHLSQSPETYDLLFSTSASKNNIMQYDILPSNAPFPIVSNRALHVLQEFCLDDIQIFPVEIQSDQSTNDTYTLKNNFWAINFVKLVDAININESDLVLDCDNDIMVIEKLVFNKIDFDKSDFIIARDYHFKPLIIASPQLKEAFEKHKIKGCEFLTDEQYNRLSF